jgi:hypothetical protein
MSQATYPVVAEIWTLFEGTLQTQAKRLVEDIAKHHKADPKSLWAKIKPQIRIGLLDVELPDPLTTVCSHPSALCDGGAIRLRCRAPCVLGFDACQRHVGIQNTTKTAYEKVDRVIDYEGRPYFVDSRAIAHDRDGRPRGYVKEGVLYLFEKTLI